MMSIVSKVKKIIKKNVFGTVLPIILNTEIIKVVKASICYRENQKHEMTRNFIHVYYFHIICDI